MKKPLALHTILSLIFLILLLGITGPIQAHEAHTNHTAAKQHLAISVVMDDSGTLWRASVNNGFVMVSSSADLGKSFSKPVKANSQAMKVAARGEARPKLAIAKDGNIYLTWTESLKQRFAGYIWFSRSVDGGKSFEQPFIVHQDRAPITHRFDALNVTDDGKITVIWVDKRDLILAKKTDKPYTGAAIYYAVSTDEGKSFTPEKKLADSSCECCRIATTSNPAGKTVALWRHVFKGGERDHMMAEIPDDKQKSTFKRASYGHWKINGCPHHGAAIARGGEGENWWGYHMAYFDGQDKKPGLYYSRMDGVAWAAFPAKRFGDFKKQAGHPALVSLQHNDQEIVWLAWRETDGKNHQILVKHSTDGGRSWAEPRQVASADGKVDYPQFATDGKSVYLVWNTKASGLLVTSLQD